MNNLLINLFIKNADPSDPESRSKCGTLSAVVGSICNLILFAAKLFIGTISGSIAITADAFNNLSDLGSCAISLFGMRLAARPADKEHPFGHGRYEYITTLVVAVMILLVAFELGKSSVERILSPEPVEFSIPLLAVLIISICVKLWVFFFNRKLGKKINSGVIEATAVDSVSDAVSTFVVLLATIVGAWFDISLDGWMGLLVAAFILYSGINVIKENLGYILGQAPSKELSEAIYSKVLAYDGVLGVHDLVVHNYGPTMYMATIHVEVDSREDILVSHDLMDQIEKNVGSELGIILTVHMDPLVTNSEKLNEAKEVVTRICAQIDPQISMHDFRMVDGPTHTNLIFDVLLPYSSKLDNTELRQTISEQIEEYNSTWYTVITIDREFV